MSEEYVDWKDYEKHRKKEKFKQKLSSIWSKTKSVASSAATGAQKFGSAVGRGYSSVNKAAIAYEKAQRKASKGKKSSGDGFWGYSPYSNAPKRRKAARPTTKVVYVQAPPVPYGYYPAPAAAPRRARRRRPKKEKNFLFS